jgi:hypothetical protein
MHATGSGNATVRLSATLTASAMLVSEVVVLQWQQTLFADQGRTTATGRVACMMKPLSINYL